MKEVNSLKRDVVNPRRHRPQQRQQLRVRRRDDVLQSSKQPGQSPPAFPSASNRRVPIIPAATHLTLATQNRPHHLPRHFTRLQARRHPPGQQPRREALKQARLDVPRAKHRRPDPSRAVNVAQLEREPLVERERGRFAGSVWERDERVSSQCRESPAKWVRACRNVAYRRRRKDFGRMKWTKPSSGDGEAEVGSARSLRWAWNKKGWLTTTCPWLRSIIDGRNACTVQ